MGHRCSRGCLGSMIFKYFTDQGFPHVMSCQFEPMFTQDKIKDIILLISRSILTDEQIHVIPEANKLLDRVGLEIANGSVSFYIPLMMSTTFKLYGIPSDSNRSLPSKRTSGGLMADVPCLDLLWGGY